MRNVGVLALQGGFQSHLEKLLLLGVHAFEVRNEKELSLCDALILPGGESTTMTLLLETQNLKNPLVSFAKQKPVFGTCAGMILLSKLGLLNVAIARNAYGSQQNSFSTKVGLNLPHGITDFEAIFIRAPKIKALFSDEIKVLARLHGDPILVEKDNLLAASFHPELTDNLALHRYFLTKVNL